MGAYAGYLIRLGGVNGTILPPEFIRYDSFEVEPDQRMDLDSSRDLRGVLHRNVLAHTATRIDFTVPHLNKEGHDTLLKMLHDNMSNTHSKTITLQYWDDEWSTYKTGKFYMPDLKFKIRSIDNNFGILYDECKLTFIEY